jgi:glycine dehydrogenase
MIRKNFLTRHVGPRDNDVKNMLETLGVKSLDELVDEIVPSDIRLKEPLNLEEGMSEYEYLHHVKQVASRNKVYKSYIGLGYYNTIVPSVILRNVFENPGWYTSYTPYQAEISQGRLEALLNYQTMISEMTGLPLANASLLDEATAAAEAMLMFYHAMPRKKAKSGANVFLVSEDLFPQTIEVISARAQSLGIELKVVNRNDFDFNEKVFGCIFQYPDQKGEIIDFTPHIQRAKEAGVPVSVAADLMSLALLTPPGEMGADVVLGTTQRFGVPLGYGGPHAAYFATTEDYKRQMPGRIIGISKDANGNPALRMALQTREQHIKREKATSNICTAQALLAIMAGFYAVYHGKEGIRNIAEEIHSLAVDLGDNLEKYGYVQENEYFFDTLYLKLPDHVHVNLVREKALAAGMNFRYFEDGHIGISIDETTSRQDIKSIIELFAGLAEKEMTSVNFAESLDNRAARIQKNLIRTSSFLDHAVFNKYHSETEMMRYMKTLENKDIGLNRSMIPLGSCTMKLNAATTMMPISWPEFTDIHPFVPREQALGYQEVVKEMERILCEITGFAGMTFQPNSGAAGEYTGLKIIRRYHISQGEEQRNVCLIPASAHGTNPASAVMAGMKVVVIKTDGNGNIDIEDLKAKAEANKENLAALMITYPSTHGIFEEGVREIIRIIHENGGQVYMDGANMNAQVGLTSPGYIGADVCHLNLHKTFGIPHGGGGPGVGPVGVAEHLKPFLPGHPLVETGGEQAIHAVSAAPYGSALVLLISYGYLKLLGGEGLTTATKMALLNANYLMKRLEESYPILYKGKNGRVGHEMILDCNAFNKTANITVVDIAKRLMDYGFHAPTVAFPVHGTLMVEPTESEPKEELDYFAEAMKVIREEIAEVEDGKAEKGNNVVANAPHTAEMVISDSYSFPYPREKAAYPLEWVRTNKYFVPVAKIDDAYGDRNLCACLPIEEYDNPVVEVKEL